MDDTALADPPAGRELTHDELELFVVDVVRLHADGLLRLARRHSLCADDAQDAYQRGLEIFLRHAARLDRERAPSWLRTVVKHEAMAVRRGRLREVGTVETDFDQFEAATSPSPEDQAIGFEHVARSAEALQRLKPQEVRALWLRAQGNSYDEIQELTGWTRTKVNRCLYEGRRSFLARYAGIESGEECRRWESSLSSLVDGEASAQELLELRPHLKRCASCRASVRELHRAGAPLAVVFPVGVVLLAGDHAEPASHVFMKVYETTSTWLSERAASSFVRGQLLVEAVAGSAVKSTAVAASAAAVAGGGAVAVQQVTAPVEGAGRAAAVAPIGHAVVPGEARGSVHTIAVRRVADHRHAVHVRRARAAQSQAASQQTAAARRSAVVPTLTPAAPAAPPRTISSAPAPAASTPAAAGGELGFE